MAEEKRVLVKLGDSNWPVSFLSDGENDQDVLKKEVRKVYCDEIPESSSFILQIKDEEWGGEFVDISPSQTKIAGKSILKVHYFLFGGTFSSQYAYHDDTEREPTGPSAYWQQSAMLQL